MSTKMTLSSFLLPKITMLAILIILLLSMGCEKDNQKLILSQNDTLNFYGNFRFTDSDTNLGTVTLKASSNFYYCTTSFPYGHGAGDILIDESSIDFVDTLFFIIPAIYGPSYVLSGKYKYQFDGQKLSISTDKESDNMIYNLRLEK